MTDYFINVPSHIVSKIIENGFFTNELDDSLINLFNKTSHYNPFIKDPDYKIYSKKGLDKVLFFNRPNTEQSSCSLIDIWNNGMSIYNNDKYFFEQEFLREYDILSQKVRCYNSDSYKLFFKKSSIEKYIKNTSHQPFYSDKLFKIPISAITIEYVKKTPEYYKFVENQKSLYDEKYMDELKLRAKDLFKVREKLSEVDALKNGIDDSEYYELIDHLNRTV